MDVALLASLALGLAVTIAESPSADLERPRASDVERIRGRLTELKDRIAFFVEQKTAELDVRSWPGTSIELDKAMPDPRNPDLRYLRQVAFSIYFELRTCESAGQAAGLTDGDARRIGGLVAVAERYADRFLKPGGNA